MNEMENFGASESLEWRISGNLRWKPFLRILTVQLRYTLMSKIQNSKQQQRIGTDRTVLPSFLNMFVQETILFLFFASWNKKTRNK